MPTKITFIFFLILVSSVYSKAQTSLNIQGVITSMDTMRSRVPAEKLYIQFDKPYYVTGDTIRMKAYLLDAALLKASYRSGIVYVELANDTNKVVFKRMLPVGHGLGTGNIVLNKNEIPEGSYTLRAYTNLMRNFGEDLVFKKDLYISGNSSRNWLVGSQTFLSKKGDKENLRLALQFSEINNRAVALRELDVRVLDGTTVIQRDKVKTDITGKLDVNFNLPDQMQGNNLTVIATDSRDETRKIAVPIPVSRDEKVDLQFMPEGGNMVAGIPSVIGFKGIGEDGRGVDLSGKIVSGTREVAVFNSTYKGMGSFEMTPNEGESYTARITFANGTTKNVPLPPVKNAGTVMGVESSADSIVVRVSANIAAADNNVYYLTAQSRGIICYAAGIRLSGNAVNIKKIAKSLFPTGITRITLMSSDKQPLNERLVFINHDDNLTITITPLTDSFHSRDSIALGIIVEDQDGKPVEGSFSLAVTDDNQVRTDSLGSNLLTSLLLTSDLKGTVEEPGHYFLPTAQSAKDLNNLLLTQGWVGYDWKEVFNPPAAPAYPAEPQFLITGKVTNALNKGSERNGVQIFSLKPSFMQVSTTGADGSFSFGGLPLEENMKYFIQAKNKNNKNFNVGIKMDETTPAEFKAAAQRYLPWYVNSDTLLLRQAITSAVREAKLNGKGGNLLAEVTINAKKIISDSKNLNGPGGADLILDEKDMAAGPKRTLLNVMEENVKGFNVNIWPAQNSPTAGINNISATPIHSVSGPGGMGTDSRTKLGTTPYFFEKTMSYLIYDKELHMVIDGVDVESLYFPTPGWPYPTTNAQLALQRTVMPGGNYILERNSASPDDRQRFIKTYLDHILAEDIKGIEVMSDPKFSGRYKAQYAPGAMQSLSVAGADFVYVEITTYSGNGAFIKSPPGAYLHKPLSYVNTASFYRPRYTAKMNPLSDFRSTIHWEPDIVTDKSGKAIVSFFSTDNPGTYSIIIEGSNMSGNIGRKTGTIIIK